MDKIKTPVWDGGDTSILDANGRQIAFAVFSEMSEIVQTLNNAADQSRVIKGLIEGLKHYADESFWDDPHPDLRYGEGTQYNFEDEIAGQMPGYQVAQAVIAEAQRIMEGK